MDWTKNKMIPFGEQRNGIWYYASQLYKIRHQIEAWFPSAFLTHITSNRSRVSSRAHRNTSKPLERISVGLSIATYIFHLCNVRKLSNDFFQFLFYHDASFSRTLHKSNSFLDIGKIRRIIIYELALNCWSTVIEP